MIGTEKDYETFLEEQRQSITHIKYGDKIELFRRHQLALTVFDKQLLVISGLKKLSSQYDYDLFNIKKKHMYAITKELDAGNALMFKNRESRDSELAIRLLNNPDYQKLFEMNEDIGDQLIDAEARLISFKSSLKFYESWAK